MNTTIDHAANGWDRAVYVRDDAGRLTGAAVIGDDGRAVLRTQDARTTTQRATVAVSARVIAKSMAEVEEASALLVEPQAPVVQRSMWEDAHDSQAALSAVQLVAVDGDAREFVYLEVSGPLDALEALAFAAALKRQTAQMLAGETAEERTAYARRRLEAHRRVTGCAK